MLAPAALERLTLLLNHVLGSEPAAVERLRPHAGRAIEIQLEAWPALLPRPPCLRFRITPAGLLEWESAPTAAAAELEVRLDASNPALLLLDALSGANPSLRVQGDATLATDVNWLFENLRWDIEADLERLLGAAAAHEVARTGAWLARGLRAALQGAGSLAARVRPERAAS